MLIEIDIESVQVRRVVGRCIRLRREQRGLTRVGLAHLASVASPTVMLLEMGHLDLIHGRSATRKQASRVCAVLGLDLGDLEAIGKYQARGILRTITGYLPTKYPDLFAAEEV